MALCIPTSETKALDIDVEWAAIGKQGGSATSGRRIVRSYTALGAMYVQDERFKAHYEGVAAGLAEYVRDAMAAYAAARLS
jgi:hypothetical protein